MLFKSNGGDFMTQSKSSRPSKNLALMAMSFAMLFGTFLLPAYGQECDPSWFNPWAQSSAETAQSSQAKAAKSGHSQDQHSQDRRSLEQAKAKSASSHTVRVRKASAKRSS
jgi:hypothetical protein